MATVTKPIALDESLNTTEQTPRNIADVLAQELSRITGRNASQVEYDNSESGLDADNVQDALDEIAESVPTLPTTDIQTAVDEFSTYNGGLLSSLKVTLSPNQDLHGYPEPWVGGANVNKFPSAVAESKTASGVTVVSDGHGTYSLSGTASADVNIDFDIEQAYTIPQSIGNGGQGCCYFFNNKTLASDKFLFYFMDGTREIDSWSIVELNRKNSAYSAMSCQTCNKVRFKITVGANVDGVTISPMFSEDGLTTNPFTWWKNICPITGHTEVKVGDDGKNRFNPSNVLNAFFFGGYNITDEPQTRTIYAQCKPNTVYTVSKTAGQRFCVGYTKELPANGVVVYDKTSDNTASSITITTGADAKYIVGYVYHAQHDSITADEMLASCQIELGSTATPYVPYNGYQITINLGGTYYSGILDVVSGVFVPDTASDDLGSLTWQTRYTGSVNKTLSSSLSQKPLWAETAGEVQCEDYKYNGKVSGASILSDPDNCEVGLYLYYVQAQESNAKVCYLVIPVDNSPDDKVVYELNDTTPIQLIPTPVKANVGENHLSAPLDGQEIVESKYKQIFTFDDVIAYIQSLS